MSAWFDIYMPRHQGTAVIFAAPHSGRVYPPSLLKASVLDPARLRSSEDWRVDHLFAHALRCDALALRVRAPRAWVDLNRRRDELDPALIDGARRPRLGERVNAGLGVVPRVVAAGRAIYRGKLTQAEAEARLVAVWDPYHAALQHALAVTRCRFGRAILLDCHSMPHEALEMLPGPRPDIVLGDRFGRAAAAPIVDGVAAAFTRAGFRVARNRPFAGAFICERYGQPDTGVHCIQIEIDRALYQEPDAPFTPGPKLAALRQRLRPVIQELARLGAASGVLAAE